MFGFDSESGFAVVFLTEPVSENAKDQREGMLQARHVKFLVVLLSQKLPAVVAFKEGLLVGSRSFRRSRKRHMVEK